MATGPRVAQPPALPASPAVWGQPGEGQPVCPLQAQVQGGGSAATSSPTPSHVHVRGPTVYPRLARADESWSAVGIRLLSDATREGAGRERETERCLHQEGHRSVRVLGWYVNLGLGLCDLLLVPLA